MPWPFAGRVRTCHFSLGLHTVWLDGCVVQMGAYFESWMSLTPCLQPRAHLTLGTHPRQMNSPRKPPKKQGVMCWAVKCATHAVQVSYLPLPDSCRTQPGWQGQKTHPAHPFCSCCCVMARVNRDRCRL